MAERRMIHKKISVSADLAALDKAQGRSAVLFYTWLIPHLDRWGCAPADASTLRGMVCPLFKDVTDEHVKRWVAWMLKRGMLERVSGQNGERGVRVPRFHDHQAGTHFDRETPSRFEPNDITRRWKRTQSTIKQKAVISRGVRDVSGLSPTKSPEVKGREGKPSPSLPTPSPYPSSDESAAGSVELSPAAQPHPPEVEVNGNGDVPRLGDLRSARDILLDTVTNPALRASLERKAQA